jgi:hypothetical protein
MGTGGRWPDRGLSAALYLLQCNFVCIHWPLKVTPAKAAGVASKLWEISDMVTVLKEWASEQI